MVIQLKGGKKEMNLKCPNCEEVFDFKNMVLYDDEQMKIIGIVYSIKCLNCGTVFISDNRTPSKQSTKQANEFLNTVKQKMEKE